MVQRFFSKILSFIFLGQIWSKSLKFPIFSEIWYRGILLHAYYNFNFFFFPKALSLMFFGEIWSDKLVSSNWLKFRRVVHCYMFITVLMFTFSNFLSVKLFMDKFGPIIWSSTKWLTFRRGVHYYMPITIFMIIFSNNNDYFFI